MPTQEEIYQTEGDKYEALIAREDYQGNILKSLREITTLKDRIVLDLGAGTGRLACLLAPYVSRVRAFDISEEMLRVCREKLSASGLVNWQVDVADRTAVAVVDHQGAGRVVPVAEQEDLVPAVEPEGPRVATGGA